MKISNDGIFFKELFSRFYFFYNSKVIGSQNIDPSNMGSNPSGEKSMYTQERKPPANAARTYQPSTRITR